MGHADFAPTDLNKTKYSKPLSLSQPKGKHRYYIAGLAKHMGTDFWSNLAATHLTACSSAYGVHMLAFCVHAG